MRNARKGNAFPSVSLFIRHNHENVVRILAALKKTRKATGTLVQRPCLKHVTPIAFDPALWLSMPDNSYVDADDVRCLRMPDAQNLHLHAGHHAR